MADLDEASGVVAWRLRAINSDTGLPPEDPLAGFLPPNVDSPEGEGSVQFRVQQKPGLVTGTGILNDASIIFDANAPIQTPVWVNTIDVSNPVCQALPLDAVQTGTVFPVEWSGDDEGVGVHDFSVFVSTDGGPFESWLVNTPQTAANFVGENGSSYEFFCTARDMVGNAEEQVVAAEARTKVLVSSADNDGDGIFDSDDKCPSSILFPTVVIDGCDSGAPNVYGHSGSTISDRVKLCAGQARNHGHFVGCVVRETSLRKGGGKITDAQAAAIRRCAAQAKLP